MKKNFIVDERIVINRTASPILDGAHGTIVGKSSIDITDTYIVLLDKQLDSSYPCQNAKAITIPEGCLDLCFEG